MIVRCGTSANFEPLESGTCGTSPLGFDTYADDYLGYIPPLRELENWGYEVWTTKLASEGIVQFKDAGLNLVSNAEISRNQ